jgi:Tfp pilus assembly protein PilO
MAELNMEVVQIAAAREELASVQAEYQLGSRVLPSESTPDQLLGAIRTKAQQAGVIPSQLRPDVVRQGSAGGRRGGKQAPTGKFEEWRFNLTISGSYDQIANFINRMEEFESNDPQRVGAERRFFQVQSVEITAAGNGLANLTSGTQAVGKSPGHECRLMMQTYRYTGDDN